MMFLAFSLYAIGFVLFIYGLAHCLGASWNPADNARNVSELEHERRSLEEDLR